MFHRASKFRGRPAGSRLQQPLVSYTAGVVVKPALYSQVEPFGQPHRSRAIIEIAATFVPYIVLIAAMMIIAQRGHPFLALALSVVAAAFLVRVFVIFHDCCHGSFFRNRQANRFVGYLGGILTATPFEKWQQSHAVHHATVGDLDRRGAGDVWTLTVDEYCAASPARRLFYRVFRNPFVMFGIGPALIFLFGNRFAGRGASKRERISVHVTNAALITAVVVGHFTVGLPILLLTILPTMLLAGSIGVWLFYVQHQFDEVYWARREAWEPLKAALEGSSYYKLPKVLQWFTGSIGLHHIHHVQPRIPFYNLQECQDTIPAFQEVPPLTIRRSLDSLRLRLFDEAEGRMVTWTDIVAARRAGR
jgi:acyl-lipid omega-6 desaturase (Delta-12 desaturase)